MTMKYIARTAKIIVLLVASRAAAQAQQTELPIELLSHFTVQHPPLPVNSLPASFTTTIEIAGRPYTLAARKYSMRAPDYQLIEDRGGGRLVEVEPGPVRTYRGHLLEAPLARVRATLTPGGQLSARVTLDGQTWLIEPAFAGNNALRSGHIVYPRSAMLPTNHACGNSDTPIALPADNAPHEGHADDDDFEPRGGGTAPFWRTRIAFDADFEFFQDRGSNSSNVETFIDDVMDDVEDIYEDDVRICYQIGTIIVRTTSNDPYTNTTNPSTLLNQFKDHWNSSHAGVSRSVAHLFTGRDLDGNTIGIAFRPGIACTNGQPDLELAYGLSMDFFGLHEQHVELTAHELGHNWNACHCNESDCNVSDPACIMYSSIGFPGRDAFRGNSINQIAARRDLVAACQLTECGCGSTMLLTPGVSPDISEALNILNCGSTLFLIPGTYNESFLTAPNGSVVISTLGGGSSLITNPGG